MNEREEKIFTWGVVLGLLMGLFAAWILYEL